MSGSTWSYRLELLDGKPIDVADKGVYVNFVSPGWFKTYGTRLIAGRDFTSADTRGAAAVAIVNEAFARKFTGGANPLGRTRARALAPERAESRARDRRLRGRRRVSLAARPRAADDVPAVRAESDAAVVCVDQRAVGDRFSARPDEGPRRRAHRL